MARIAMRVILAVGWIGVACATYAHPHEEDELADHMARLLREIGRPCESVVHIEETTTKYIITCDVVQENVTKQVVYVVAKQS